MCLKLNSWQTPTEKRLNRTLKRYHTTNDIHIKISKHFYSISKKSQRKGNNCRHFSDIINTVHKHTIVALKTILVLNTQRVSHVQSLLLQETQDFIVI